MKCEEFEILISASIDGEATEEEEQILESHLHGCAACQGILNEFSALHTLSQELETKEPPPGFRQRVTQRIDRQPHKVLAWRRLPRFVYALSLALLVIISGTIIAVYLQQEQTSPGIDVYAEDILFEQTVSSEESLFFGEYETNIAEEILDTIDFAEADTSMIGEDSSPNRPVT